MSLTNEKGDFEIAYAKPAMEITMNLSPRGMAPKLFTVSTGPEDKTLIVTEGATVRGRRGRIGRAQQACWNNLPQSPDRDERGRHVCEHQCTGRTDLVRVSEDDSVASRGIGGAAIPCETKDGGQEVTSAPSDSRPPARSAARSCSARERQSPPRMRITLGTDWRADSRRRR